MSEPTSTSTAYCTAWLDAVTLRAKVVGIYSDAPLDMTMVHDMIPVELFRMEGKDYQAARDAAEVQLFRADFTNFFRLRKLYRS